MLIQFCWKRSTCKAGEREKDGRGGDEEAKEREGHGGERGQGAHFQNFKAKDNSVLIFLSLGVLSVSLPFVDLKN